MSEDHLLEFINGRQLLTKEDLYAAVSAYGVATGTKFTVIRTKKRSCGDTQSVDFGCSKSFLQRELMTRSETGCPAVIRFVLTREGYQVRQPLQLEHSHPTKGEIYKLGTSEYQQVHAFFQNRSIQTVEDVVAAVLDFEALTHHRYYRKSVKRNAAGEVSVMQFVCARAGSDKTNLKLRKCQCPASFKFQSTSSGMVFHANVLFHHNHDVEINASKFDSICKQDLPISGPDFSTEFDEIFPSRTLRNIDEFKNKLDIFQERTGTIFKKLSVHKRLKRIEWSCVRAGVPAEPVGRRRCRPSQKTGCPVRLVTKEKADEVVEVRHVYLQHNHDITPLPYKPQYRRLTREEVEICEPLLKSTCASSIVRHYIEEQFDKQLTRTDISNLRRAYRGHQQDNSYSSFQHKQPRMNGQYSVSLANHSNTLCNDTSVA